MNKIICVACILASGLMGYSFGYKDGLDECFPIMQEMKSVIDSLHNKLKINAEHEKA